MGLWDYEEDFYNPADAERVWQEWFNDGGRIDTPPNNTLRELRTGPQKFLTLLFQEKK